MLVRCQLTGVRDALLLGVRCVELHRRALGADLRVRDDREVRGVAGIGTAYEPVVRLVFPHAVDERALERLGRVLGVRRLHHPAADIAAEALVMHLDASLVGAVAAVGQREVVAEVVKRDVIGVQPRIRRVVDLAHELSRTLRGIDLGALLAGTVPELRRDPLAGPVSIGGEDDLEVRGARADVLIPAGHAVVHAHIGQVVTVDEHGRRARDRGVACVEGQRRELVIAVHGLVRLGCGGEGVGAGHRAIRGRGVTVL